MREPVRRHADFARAHGQGPQFTSLLSSDWSSPGVVNLSTVETAPAFGRPPKTAYRQDERITMDTQLGLFDSMRFLRGIFVAGRLAAADTARLAIVRTAQSTGLRVLKVATAGVVPHV